MARDFAGNEVKFIAAELDETGGHPTEIYEGTPEVMRWVITRNILKGR